MRRWNSPSQRENRLLIGLRILGAVQDNFHILEMPPRGVEHCEAGREGLDGKPGLDELQGADLVAEIAVAKLARGPNIGAAAETPRDQSSLFQLIQRTPHGAAGSVERRR